MKCKTCKHLVYGTVYKQTRRGMISKLCVYCDRDHSRKVRVMRCENYERTDHPDIVRIYP